MRYPSWIKLRRYRDGNEYMIIQGTQEEVDAQFLELISDGWAPWIWSNGDYPPPGSTPEVLMKYVIARNRSKRPTLQHVLHKDGRTVCGLDMMGWSREYSSQPIPTLLCFRCKVGQESL
jgi:hypothetical protein